MAKNKNRKQAGRQESSGQTGRTPGQPTPADPALDAEPQTSPADADRKQRRRFGHN